MDTDVVAMVKRLRELADKIEQYKPHLYLTEKQWRQIIAALRRSKPRCSMGYACGDFNCQLHHPRQPSSDQVLVPKKLLADIEEGYRSRCEYCHGIKAACEELDVKYGIPCLAREAWCALAAAEAEGRKV